MNYQSLSFEIEDHVATVALNNPKKCNALGQDFWLEFPKLLTLLNENDKVRVMILKGNGKHFCSGIDTNLFFNNPFLLKKNSGYAAYQLRNLIQMMQTTINYLETVKFPVLVAIDGACMGAGLDLICAADCRYATGDAWFAIEETNLGLIADLGTLQRLPKLIPLGVVKEMAFTGKRITAQQAHDVGLINQVLTDYDHLLTHVYDIAQAIAQKPPLMMAGLKHNLNHISDLPPYKGLDFIATWQSAMIEPEDILKSLKGKHSKVEVQFKNLSDQAFLKDQ